MERTDTEIWKPVSYTHLYAGKYIKFHVRISSGASSVSSAWKDSDIVRLPYVKLNTPLVQALSLIHILAGRNAGTVHITKSSIAPTDAIRIHSRNAVSYTHLKE